MAFIVVRCSNRWHVAVMTTHRQAIANPIAARTGSVRFLVILSALMAFASISTDIYLPAMPTLGRAFHSDPQITLSGFLVGFSLGQLLWGPIGDRYGRRIPIAIGVVLFVIGSAGCALSATVWQMTGWRVVEAVGACAGPVLARAMVRDLYARDRSAQMLSTLMLVMGVAPLVGPIVGGQIIAYWSWQAIFWVLVGMGLLALVGLLALPETLPQSRRSSQRVGEALVAYVLLASNPRLLGYAVAGGAYYGGLYAYLAGTPFAYITYYHVPAQAYGLLFGVNIAGMMSTNLINSRLVMRLGTDRLFRIGTGIAALSGLALAADARTGFGGLAGLAVPLFCYVSMLGFIVANSVAGALAAFPHKAGAASALVGAMHYGTGVLTAALVGWCADGTPWTMGWIVALGGVGAFVVAMLFVRTARQDA
jgi:DHA1 family bicyclomycin/chloramphenicol resistance-like MFS transporter